jgi:hypothetical protein
MEDRVGYETMIRAYPDDADLHDVWRCCISSSAEAARRSLTSKPRSG